jgi:hypothetical protein
MNLKTIIVVIIVSVAVGVGIYWFTLPKTQTLSDSAPKEVPISTNTSPSSSPLPSEPPIDKTTDLEAEIKNQTAPDFTEDYKKIKEEVNTTF